MTSHNFLLSRLLPENTNFDFLKIKLFTYLLSVAGIIATIVWLYLYSLNFSIDFTGGVVFEVRSSKGFDIAAVRSDLENLQVGDVSIQSIGHGTEDVMIRVGVSDNKKYEKTVELVTGALLGDGKDQLEFRKVEFVGAEMGTETIKKGVLAILLTFVGIVIYIWYRFSWHYSVGIIIGLIHDMILTLGFLAITRYDFNTTSIAAILTILGYSVNDTIVVYDRIRENFRKYTSKQGHVDIINLSLNETLSRTLLTSISTLIAAGALILFGGKVLYSFSMTVFVGIIIGTYSSIFISVPLLALFISKQNKHKKSL